MPARGQALFASTLLVRTPPARAMFSGIVEEMGKVRRLEKVDRMEMWDGTVGEGWELEGNGYRGVKADQTKAIPRYIFARRNVMTLHDRK